MEMMRLSASGLIVMEWVSLTIRPPWPGISVLRLRSMAVRGPHLHHPSLLPRPGLVPGVLVSDSRRLVWSDGTRLPDWVISIASWRSTPQSIVGSSHDMVNFPRWGIPLAGAQSTMSNATLKRRICKPGCEVLIGYCSRSSPTSIAWHSTPAMRRRKWRAFPCGSGFILRWIGCGSWT